MKTILTILAVTLICCSSPPEEKYQQQEEYPLTIYSDSLPQLTLVQREALDALNSLQKSTDVKNRLYSTFANLDHACYPADTRIVITQAQLLRYMKQFISENCRKLDSDTQEELANHSVLAQQEYTVLYCNKDSSDQDFTDGLPMTGTWIIPNILERRDLILVW